MITPPKSPRSSERARPVRRLCFFWSRKKPQTAGRLDDRLAALPLSPKPRSEPFFQGPALCTGPVYSQGLRASPPTFVTLLLFGAATLLLKRFKDWPGSLIDTHAGRGLPSHSPASFCTTLRTGQNFLWYTVQLAEGYMPRYFGERLGR